jgi:hypothetical protein
MLSPVSIIAEYVLIAHKPEAFFYQTWTSSKSGSLTEVGINLATSAPNITAGITVFRYKVIEIRQGFIMSLIIYRMKKSF